MTEIQIRIKQPDPDLYKIEKQDPDLYQSEKQDPNLYQKGLDLQHCTVQSFVLSIAEELCSILHYSLGI
jgi:hypothetical protein